MEYVFGASEADGYEIVTVKGETHTDWQVGSFQQTLRDFGNVSIVDTFKVVERQWTAEDSASNCYDRYAIESHYRIVDKSAGINESIGVVDEKTERLSADLDYLSMMADIELPNMMAEEEALLEGGM